MEMLEKVVDRANQTLGNAAEAHLVMPAIAHGFQRNGIDVVRHEC